MRHRIRVLLGLASILPLSACDDDSKDKPLPPIDAGSDSDSALPGDGDGDDDNQNHLDGSAPGNPDLDAGDDPQTDASEPNLPPVGPLSNSPGATIVVEPFSADASDLQLISSNLVVRPSGERFFEQWYAVVKNTGPNPLCHVQAEVDFLVGSTVVSEHYGFANAAPYKASISTPVACIAPGAVGVVFDNGFATTEVRPAAITEIKVILEGANYPGTVPHSLAPTFVNPRIISTYSLDYLAVTGQLRASGGTIYNVGVDVYPYDDAGLVFDQLIDTNLDTIYSGTSWTYETLSTNRAAFSTFEQFADFLPGTKSAKDSGSPIATLEAERRKHAAAVRERRRAFRDE